jgi:Sad1 / UNC-like C-terminal
MNSSFRAGKGKGLKHIARKGLLAATLWLLLEPTIGLSQASGPLINLLDPKKGGQVMAETKDVWLNTINGKENSYFEFDWDEWAIYAFKDERPATFDTFAVLIPGKGNNMKDFELLAGNDSPTGNFDSIGTFTTTNARLTKSLYQEFKFPPVTAKYLKVQLQSGWEDHRGARVFQFRLFGRLKQ